MANQVWKLRPGTVSGPLVSLVTPGGSFDGDDFIHHNINLANFEAVIQEGLRLIESPEFQALKYREAVKDG